MDDKRQTFTLFKMSVFVVNDSLSALQINFKMKQNSTK